MDSCVPPRQVRGIRCPTGADYAPCNTFNKFSSEGDSRLHAAYHLHHATFYINLPIIEVFMKFRTMSMSISSSISMWWKSMPEVSISLEMEEKYEEWQMEEMVMVTFLRCSHTATEL